jgi:putative membrane protein
MNRNFFASKGGWTGNARDILPQILFGVLSCAWTWSAYMPAQPGVWVAEVLPALALTIGLAWSGRYWPLTPLSRVLIVIGIVLILIGAHYTYAEMPLFTQVRDALGHGRNHYDRVGHLFAGAVPAIVIREVLVRRSILDSPAWRTLFVLCFCLAVAAGWELLEWITTVQGGVSSEHYMGAQGDGWDTQADMACALVGAVVGLGTLSRWHDRQLGAMGDRSRELESVAVFER